MIQFKHTFLVGIMGLSLWGCWDKEPAIPDNPLNGRTTAVFNPTKNYGTVTDIEGNVYKTIVIGTQTWMAENLRTTKYRNGDEIYNVTSNDTWNSLLSTGAYCTYANTTNLDTIATYGRLYNFFAVADNRQLAPQGWRVATMDDWLTLTDYLGGDTIASNKMKEVGNKHWEDPFLSDNSSGFTALPGSDRYLAKNTDQMGFYGVWWTSSEYNETGAGFLYLYYYSSNIYRGVNYKKNGYSVRCIKE